LPIIDQLQSPQDIYHPPFANLPNELIFLEGNSTLYKILKERK
ncbi:15148_t:CDS:1, partial [Funneliformis mosseae]